MSALLDAALDYAQREWPVVPLWWPTEAQMCACGAPDCGIVNGKPVGPAAKHPTTIHGLDDATTDETTIRAWWARWPEANIGLRTGIKFDVLDVDGDDGLDGLERAGCFVDPYAWDGPEVPTSKGFHRYLLPTGSRNRTGIVRHVDYRGVGGYVVAPPSRHISGHRYSGGLGGPDVPLEQRPEWLRIAMEPPRQPPPATVARGSTAGITSPSALQANTSGLVATVALAAEGERNDRLHWAASRLAEDYRARKLTAEQTDRARADLLTAAARAGLSETEAVKTINSAFGRSS